MKIYAPVKDFNGLRNNVRFVNGVGDRSFDVTELDPQDNGDPSFNGKILIIDIDQDETIDVLFVDIMKTMVVSKVVKTNGGFYITGQNLLTLTKYSGQDPEVNTTSVWSAGIDYCDFYPTVATVLVGVNISFK